MERTKITWGVSANDHKGMNTNQAARAIEGGFSTLYLFLSGNKSEVTLPIAIPTVRGGTGASTDKEHGTYVGNYGSRNFMPVWTRYVPVAQCFIGHSESEVRVLTDLDFTPTIEHIAEGKYKVTCKNGIAISNDNIQVSKDNMGNQIVGYSLEYVDDSCIITVYHLMFDAKQSKFVLNTGFGPKDIPDQIYLAFTLVNKNGTL